MTPAEIRQLRLHNQQITTPAAGTPQALVGWLGAVQAQDYPAARWALGLRLPAATAETIEQAVSSGAILRTHILRPTWHFVTPADIRWMLALTAPNVHSLTRSRQRQLELDDKTFRAAETALARALEGGRQLTRPEIAIVLQEVGLDLTDIGRTTHLLMHAELAGVICSGGWRAGQATYALLDERVPTGPSLTHEEAVVALTQRYFTSHGPATTRDFAWWSGLKAADVRAGLAGLAAQLQQATVADQTYWFMPPSAGAPDPAATVYLLPNFDEYTVGYAERSLITTTTAAQHLGPRGNVLFIHTIVCDGQVVGTWKRTINKGATRLETQLAQPLTPAQHEALDRAIARYGAFLATPVTRHDGPTGQV